MKKSDLQQSFLLNKVNIVKIKRTKIRICINAECIERTFQGVNVEKDTKTFHKFKAQWNFKKFVSQMSRVNTKSGVLYVDTTQSKPVIKYKISMKSEVENRLKNIILYLM